MVQRLLVAAQLLSFSESKWDFQIELKNWVQGLLAL